MRRSSFAYDCPFNSLTHECSRVAMIWDEDSPHPECAKPVKDWFIEWCLESQQKEIGKQKLAIDCPWCGNPC